MRAALHGIDPASLIRRAADRGQLPRLSPDTPLFVVAAGKAAVRMTGAFIGLGAGRILAGIGSGPAEPASVPSGWRWFAGGHPDPNAASVEAGRAALQLAHACAAQEGTLVVLLSGGASALLAAPSEGIALEDQIAAAGALMRAGVAIDGLNCVRKHLSAIKGGQLGAAARRSITLAISDVHGPVPDDPSVIGSGPTVPDPTTFAEALDVVRRSGASVPLPVVRHLERGVAGELAETIKPGDPRLAGAAYAVVGRRHDAMAAARDAAGALHYSIETIDAATGGESRLAGPAFVEQARRLATRRPACVIASGETTVRVTGRGRGGRNQEFALAAADALQRSGEAAVLVSVGTDGIDGPTDAAGGIVDSETAARARRAQIDLAAHLRANDAYPALAALDGLLHTGPTGTNVGDLHLLLLG